jgi:hypothetical protein
MSVKHSSVSSPGLFRILGVLLVMDLVVHLFGLKRALTFAGRSGVSRQAVSADFALIDDIAMRVATAAAFYPRRALCLEQSLALFVLLRRRGIAAGLRFGVQTLPFSAHAWVEVDGRPINERQGVIERLVTFQQVGV